METAFVESLKSASPLVLVLLLVNGVGMALKSIKRVNNDIIPFILIPLGAVTCMGLLGNTDVPFECPYPWAYKLVLGAIIGAGSVGVHQAVQHLKERNKPPEVKLVELEERKTEIQTEIASKPPPP